MREGKDSWSFKVNGIELSSDRSQLSAREILKLAENKGAIPQKPDDYLLKGEKGEYELDSQVDLEEDSLFLALPSAAVPVAEAIYAD